MPSESPKSTGLAWNAIGGWFFLLMGAMLVVVSLVGLAYMAWFVSSMKDSNIFEDLQPPITFSYTQLIPFAILLAGGAIWVASGLAFFRKNYWIAVPGGIIGWVLSIISNMLMS